MAKAVGKSKKPQTSKTSDRTAASNEPVDTQPANSNGKYKDLIVTTIITLVVTGVFGEFIVKRNIQSYNNQWSAFDNAADNADAKFEEIRNFYNSRLKERRRASQKIIKYISDNDIAAFNEFYPTYNAAVSQWNADHDLMAKQILATTRCEEAFTKRTQDHKSRRMEAFQPIYGLHAANPAHEPFLSVSPKKPEKARKKFLEEPRFCPTFFLTKFNSGYSVHDQFRKIHRKIYNYKVHNFSECKLRHINNLENYYKSCTTKTDGEPVEICTQRYDRMVQNGDFCAIEEFDISDYKVKDIEFNELDFYWGLGDGFFRTFRENYMKSDCKMQLGFWATLLGWNCDDAVGDYFDKS